MKDTIAAIATPPGRGGVGIVRVSGPKASHICEQLTKYQPKPRNARFTVFYDAEDLQIDHGLCIFFKGPNSYTGEDVVELQAHGSPVVLDMLLTRCVALGARIARAGEFSERAFLNNKMDLLQVEAVAELINASSKQAAMAATKSLQGAFSHKINLLVEDITKLRMYVESAIDFSDEEIDFLEAGQVKESIENTLQAIDGIHQQAKAGALLNEGVNVVIAGDPNVGKSTLINCLTGEDTAIVTSIAGTTRDTISANINLDGLLLKVIDTAGVRDTSDEVEQLGIERTKKALNLADLVLLVIDANSSNKDPLTLCPEILSAVKSDAKLIVVINKIDTTKQQAEVVEFSDYSTVAISAAKDLGLNLLRAHIRTTMGVLQTGEASVFAARRRHLEALQKAKNFITGSLEKLQLGVGELVAEELRQAQLCLSEITGAFSSDDLLGRIFAEFCIGK